MSGDIHTNNKSPVWNGILKDIAARMRDKADWHRSFTNDNYAGAIAADALEETAKSIEEAIAPKPKDIQIDHTEPA